MNIKNAIDILAREVPDPSRGLPDDLFYYISETTPLVNVDLLIKDDRQRTLLAWRDDPYCGQGWHVPGGIIRFKETLESRIEKVAETEIGVEVRYDPEPIALNQLIHPRQNTRGHFISILYNCFIATHFIPQNRGRCSGDAGFLEWHNDCPDNLIPFHEIYRGYI